MKPQARGRIVTAKILSLPRKLLRRPPPPPPAEPAEEIEGDDQEDESDDQEGSGP